MISSTKGFTIVELLIVIVVIAVLATISVVSYGNIQKRSYNSQVISGVSSYHKLIQAYYSLEGRYPPTSRENDNKRIAMACLGTGYSGQFCGKVTDVDTYEDPTFNLEISKAGSAKAIADTLLTPGSESFVGGVYGIDQTDPALSGGSSYARTIQYALKGRNADCRLPGAYSYSFAGEDDVTACEIIIEPVPDRSSLGN